MGKIDLKKELKHLYKPSSIKINIIDVPKMNFLMLDGVGNPNIVPEFKEAVEALYSLSYALKFMIKKGTGIDYTVMPLEGLWWTDDMTKFSIENRDIWKWAIMIMQPDYITEDLVGEALEQVKKKKTLPAFSKIRFESYHEGQAAQIMHIGLYSEEGPTVAKLHNYIKENGYVLAGKHHEIYLSDPRKTAPEKVKTILRQPIREI